MTGTSSVEGQRLPLRHAIDSAACGEQRHQNGDHPLIFAVEFDCYPFNTGINRPVLFTTPRKAADNQDKQRDVNGWRRRCRFPWL